jgi:pyruvate/2-oxoglutarate dehydrogenase complex dihydrolipoamide acyltransferase (E2) component
MGHGGRVPARSETRLASALRAFVMVALAASGCAPDAPPPPKADPELAEIRGVLAELERAPSLERALEPPAPVDVERLPDRPIVPPEVLVKERDVGAVTAPMAAAQAEPEAPPPAVVVPSPKLPEPKAAAAAPATLAGRCAALYRERCDGKGFGTDVCVRDLVRCELTSPTVDGPPPCCPESCIEEYARQRRGGASVAAAGGLAFAVEGCLAPYAVAQAPVVAPVVPEAVAAPDEPKPQAAQPAQPQPPTPAAAERRPAPRLLAPPPRPAVERPASGLPSVEAVAPPAVEAQPVE